MTLKSAHTAFGLLPSENSYDGHACRQPQSNGQGAVKALPVLAINATEAALRAGIRDSLDSYEQIIVREIAYAACALRKTDSLGIVPRNVAVSASSGS